MHEITWEMKMKKKKTKNKIVADNLSSFISYWLRPNSNEMKNCHLLRCGSQIWYNSLRSYPIKMKAQFGCYTNQLDLCNENRKKKLNSINVVCHTPPLLMRVYSMQIITERVNPTTNINGTSIERQNKTFKRRCGLCITYKLNYSLFACRYSSSTAKVPKL